MLDYIFALVCTITGAILATLVEVLLRSYLDPVIEWLNNNGLMTIVIALLFVILVALEFSRRYSITVSKRTAIALGMVTLLTIPFAWLSMNQAGIIVSSLNLILILMVLMALTAFLSPIVPGINAILRSLMIAVPAISLGVALGASSVTFVGNTIDSGTPFPDATVIVVDHSLGFPSLSGNYPVKALTYAVVRDSNEIKVCISGLPKKESYHASKDIEIVFDGHPITPDGKERDFTLEGGKSYKLILR